MAVKIVSKELALKLKRLGFDMSVVRAYKPNTEEYFVQRIEIDANRPIFKPCFSAPSYDEVLHWLRDVHKTFWSIAPTLELGRVVYFAYLEVIEDGVWKDKMSYEYYIDYEKAQLDIINRAVELLEERLKNSKDGN